MCAFHLIWVVTAVSIVLVYSFYSIQPHFHLGKIWFLLSSSRLKVSSEMIQAITSAFALFPPIFTALKHSVLQPFPPPLFPGLPDAVPFSCHHCGDALCLTWSCVCVLLSALFLLLDWSAVKSHPGHVPSPSGGVSPSPATLYFSFEMPMTLRRFSLTS